MSNLIQNLRSLLNRLRDTLFKGLFRARFRYDVFISYSHRDAKTYAANLKKQLGALDFACFIDEEESPPGSSLDPTLAKALNKSAVLVLLATDRALTRPYIVSEFEKFAATKRTIVPINILEALTKNEEQALTRAPWNIINTRKLVWIDETEEAFGKKNPSPAIADGIDKLFKYTRRNVRVRTEIIGTAVLVLLAAFGAGFVIKGQAAEVSKQSALADVARSEKEKQQGLADDAKKDAQTQLAIARQAKTDADKAKEAADAASKEADRQQAIARTATAEADKQQALATTASLEAEKQLERSHQLRYVSDMNLAQRAYEAVDMGKLSDLLNANLPPVSKKHADVRSFYWYYLNHLSHLSFPPLPDLKGHSDRLNSVAFSGDGKMLASANSDGTVSLWTTDGWRDLTTLTGHSASVYSVLFSPNSKTLASSDLDGTVKVWSASTLQPLATLKGRPGEGPLAFSPDGKSLAMGQQDQNEEGVSLWDTNTWQESTKIPLGYVASLAFSPDGETLAVGGSSTVALWSLREGKELTTIKGYLEDVTSVAFSPNGKTLASASKTSVRLWDTNKDKDLPSLEGHSNLVYAIAFSSDGKTLASVSYDKTVKLWDTDTWEELATLQGHGGGSSVAFSPDGKTLASTGEDRDVKLWDVSTLRELTGFTGDTSDASSVAFSPDGRTLALASGETVKLWNTCADREVASWQAPATIYSVAFSPNGRTLAAGTQDHNIVLWNTDTRQELPPLEGSRGLASSVAFSPDGKTIASVSRDGALLWDTRTGRKLAAIKVDSQYGDHSVAISPDSTMLAVSDSDKLWDARTGRELATLKDYSAGTHSVAFSPVGNIFAASSEGLIKLWDTSTMRELATLKSYSDRDISLAFSPDGKTLASAGRFSSMKLWDTSTWQELVTLKSYSGGFEAVAFSPDGKTLVSVTENDNTLKFWIAATKEEMCVKSREKQ
jgi:WD40 repeat protein